MAKATEPPTQTELAIAVLELARNRHFHTVMRYLRAEREDLIYCMTSSIGDQSERFGYVSRLAGGVTALSAVLDQFISLSKTLDGTGIEGFAADTDQGVQSKAP